MRPSRRWLTYDMGAFTDKNGKENFAGSSLLQEHLPSYEKLANKCKYTVVSKEPIPLKGDRVFHLVYTLPIIRFFYLHGMINGKPTNILPCLEAMRWFGISQQQMRAGVWAIVRPLKSKKSGRKS